VLNSQLNFIFKLVELPPISAASMLTRKDIKEFKESVRRDNDAIIKVGSGETVTVRVPTHEEGRLIFWEFATDYYDIGFGLYFEWTISPSNNVTVHVSDSSEDEEGEEGI
jgi:golgi resident protein GCP60